MVSTAQQLPCGTKDASQKDLLEAAQVERDVFGKSANDMTESDFSALYQQDRSSRAIGRTSYQLVDIPLVYHILFNQSAPNRPRRYITEQQMYWGSNLTNQLYNIYNRRTKTSIQFATFVTEQLVNNTSFSSTKDCLDLSVSDYLTIVSVIPDWQFKIHVLICGSSRAGGAAYLPSTDYGVTNPRHNTIFIEDYSVACYDDNGNNLCSTFRHDKVIRSCVIAHELGHLFGLYHTFDQRLNGLLGDGVSDTPSESDQYNSVGCPGLLPYNKDRNLFKYSERQYVNRYNSPTECFRKNQTCGTTCAACQDKYNNITCCSSNIPFNSRKLRPGLDPKNNVMTYAPDVCIHEFTPGQLAKMMAQVRQYKTYIYCNYVNIVDAAKCKNVPCVSTATSPNCKK